MKRFFVVMLITMLNWGRPAAAADILVGYNFGACNSTWMTFDKNGPEDCSLDECYDSSSHECYYDDGLSNNTYCSATCENYDGSYLVYCREDGKTFIPAGCGCYLNESTEWRLDGTGRERKYTIKQTDCNGGKTTSATNEYRCAAGYYGNGTTCTRCPGEKNSAGVVVYGNSPAGATNVTQCALPAGTYVDGTGTFGLSAACAYK